MSPIKEHYEGLLKDLESRRKALVEALKEFVPLKEALQEVEEQVLKIKTKLANLGGQLELVKASPHKSDSLPYSELSVEEAGKAYLMNGAIDKTTDGVVKALQKGGIKSNKNTIQTTLYKKQHPNGPFVKNGKDWGVVHN
ncbi:MAG: hypothetical protein A3F82_08260 [Deltaproteobacteria bacterium RIFCSPLOWO2_12_FULL_44_12]|nr:MAG: hypothetical protein A2712_07015 [Deltaproteobacteria bacterium RIFCSPHIGHO2_01_FULL_43_49]OGQ15698.1 MAG: hypothetical protein A3D22_05805 [Deltaproteobacteria bacterium RIFCSPHIGHO2_02_FULL_44_53]OGQ28667.1 MAG: hypothetical protein A3D98_00540 [Deltaproteobacteria bacterium RIFCSPHIGHO2_12_FULL_44_21]OGQ31989.1 MAG: hypothetical protein A2979_02745 [Deltaproteobacteria bacterium RIFCSPLOWO2_01_FULL_45_74]OGQ43603.1 MAG: hypothetical protein A3I70_03265 [Deltaproteobacteria bacterium 